MNETRITVMQVPEGLKDGTDDSKRQFVKSLLQNIFVDDPESEYTETPNNEDSSMENTPDEQELDQETNTETL